jgi:hypothetical protein
MGVEVEAIFPDEVLVIPDENEVSAELPTPPTAYGTLQPRDLPKAGMAVSPPIRFEPVPLTNPRAPGVERRDDGVHVLFDSVTVRARGEVDLDPVWVVVSQRTPSGTLPVRWEAAATSANKRLAGQIEVAVGEKLWTASELLTDLNGNE